MLLFCFYIFNREGVCLHYHEWSRPRAARNESDDRKMMFGLLFSLKAFVSKADPSSNGEEEPTFVSYRTDKYKLHYLENPSGIRFVLLSQPNAGEMREFLKHVYDTCYVEHVVKNPLYSPGEPFKFEQFTQALTKMAKKTHV
mmetsp:Transcript_35834/g.78242  ORF Transcript_35834/g.78242 Transcript_35834/m.78242 type:complete len:142 (-) Transcript_35834:152-577(-)